MKTIKFLQHFLKNPLKSAAVLAVLVFFSSCETYIPPCSSECKNVSTPNLKCTPVTGTFTDSRDGQTYETVTICDQTWMAEHLNYDTPDSMAHIFYGSSGDSLIVYTKDTMEDGKRFYNFASALYSCPAGWHLPSNHEWNVLEINLGINPLDTVNPAFRRGCCIAPMLMSEVGWNGIGTNESKFNLIGPSWDVLWTSSFYDYPSEVSSTFSPIVPLSLSFYTYETTILNSPYGDAAKSRFCIRCIQD